MESLKLSNIFVIPMPNEEFSRQAAEAYNYLYCIGHGLRSASCNECLMLKLNKDFPLNHYQYAVLLHYPVGRRFRELAKQNWNLLKADFLMGTDHNLDII